MGNYRLSCHYCRRSSHFWKIGGYDWATTDPFDGSGSVHGGFRIMWYGTHIVDAYHCPSVSRPWWSTHFFSEYCHDHQHICRSWARISTWLKCRSGLVGCGGWSDIRRHYYAVSELALDFLRQCSDLYYCAARRIFLVSRAAPGTWKEWTL